MRYLIDTGDAGQAKEALEMGLWGVTANPSMYAANGTTAEEFVRQILPCKAKLFTMEVIGELEQMEKTAVDCARKYPGVVIKINFSADGLKLTRRLRERGISTAMTLIFAEEQASLAAQAGAEYVFVFVSRNDEAGEDGMGVVQACLSLKNLYPQLKIVAASVRNRLQVRMLEKMEADFVTVSPQLLDRLLRHPLSVKGEEEFRKAMGKKDA